MMSQSLQEAIQFIDAALLMTHAVRDRDPRGQLFDYAEQQLTFMRTVLAQGRIPNADEKRQVGVGRMAITYFENGPLNDYATALEEAAGAFHSL